MLEQYAAEDVYLQADNSAYAAEGASGCTNAELLAFYGRLGFVAVDYPGGMVRPVPGLKR